MPVWLLLLTMALVTFRATRLITTDDFPPLLWLRDRVCGGWRPLTQQEWEKIRATAAESNRDLLNPDRPKKVTVSAARIYGPLQAVDGVENRYLTRASWSPYWLGKLMSCAWCASGWVAGVVTLLTDVTVGVPDPWLAGPAVWAAGALLASREWA